MNELPIRPEQHIIDTQGLALLNIIINPSEYIFRILGERDYGIDGLLEIVENGHATGKMISLQLKSSKGFDISYSDKVNKNVLVDQFDSALFYFDGCIPVRIKKTTCNYWLNNNLPVVLVLADIETNCLYYSFIADQIRQRYQDFNNSDKDHFMFYVPVNSQMKRIEYHGETTVDFICSANKHMIFARHVRLALHYPIFLNSVQDFVINRIDYYDHINHQNADPFLSQPSSFFIKTKQLYNILDVLSWYLSFKFDRINFTEVRNRYQEQYKQFSISCDEVLELEISELHHRIMLNIKNAIQPVKDLITNVEGDYWRLLYPHVYSEAMQMSLDEFKSNCFWMQFIK